eukprot:UN3006
MKQTLEARAQSAADLKLALTTSLQLKLGDVLGDHLNVNAALPLQVAFNGGFRPFKKARLAWTERPRSRSDARLIWTGASSNGARRTTGGPQTSTRGPSRTSTCASKSRRQTPRCSWSERGYSP